MNETPSITTSLVVSFFSGLAGGAVTLALWFAYAWFTSDRTLEMGWIGTFVVFGIVLGTWYFLLFIVLALPVFRFIKLHVDSYLYVYAVLLGASTFSIGGIGVTYFLYSDKTINDYIFITILSAISGATAFFAWFRSRSRVQ